MAFGSAGHALALGLANGSAQVWNVTNPSRPRLTLPIGPPAHESAFSPVQAMAFVSSVAYSPDGSTLAVASQDGTVRLWSLDVHVAIDAICDAGGGITRQQWTAYVLQLPYDPPCRHL